MAQPATRRLITEQKAADTFVYKTDLPAAASAAVLAASSTAVLLTEQTVTTQAATYTDLTGLSIVLTVGLWRVETAGDARTTVIASGYAAQLRLTPAGALVAAASGAGSSSSGYLRSRYLNSGTLMARADTAWSAGVEFTAAQNTSTRTPFDADLLLRVTTAGSLKLGGAVSTTGAGSAVFGVGTILKATKVG